MSWWMTLVILSVFFSPTPSSFERAAGT